MIRVAFIWIAFSLNAVINLHRGYSLRESFVLHRIAAKIERA